MKKRDLQVLIIIGVASFVLAAVSWWYSMYGIMDDRALNPESGAATTSWINAPATDIARDVHALWGWTILVITPFLFGPILALFYVMFRFSKMRNPIPAKFHENVPLEVAWTILPAFFLVAMALPAYPVLKKMDYMPEDVEPDVVINVVGAQFYWQYEFPKYQITHVDDGTFTEEGVGNAPLLLPHDQVIQMYGTSYQVNHAWWVPAFGVKYDVIPGRTNDAWFVTEQEGYFKGQCAELCGELHAFMWIHVNVVPEKEFFEWLDANQAVFPLEDRQKVIQHLGEERAAEIYAGRSTS